jgi:hypothetical protein
MLAVPITTLNTTDCADPEAWRPLEHANGQFDSPMALFQCEVDLFEGTS